MKKKLELVGIIVLLCSFGLLGCSDKSSSDSKEDHLNNVAASLAEWEDNSKETEAFKKLYLTGYSDKQIGEAFVGEYSVSEWKYKEDGSKKYLRCVYTFKEEERSLIFYMDEYENVNVSEYLIEGVKQSKEEIQKCCDELFGMEPVPEISTGFSDKRLGFFTNGKWAMEITNINTMNKTINYYAYWWNFNENRMEQSEDELLTVKILSDDSMGYEISEYYKPIQWNGDDSFTMNKYNCEILFNKNTIGSRDGKSDDFWNSGMGEFKRSERPENIPMTYLEDDVEKQTTGSGNTQNITTKYIPVNGEYTNGSDGDFSRIVITAVDSSSFKFKIYKGESLIFKEHTATFESQDASIAVYQGQEYTLTFDCSQYATIVLSGFNEATTIGNTFWNSKLLHSS